MAFAARAIVSPTWQLDLAKTRAGFFIAKGVSDLTSALFVGELGSSPVPALRVQFDQAIVRLLSGTVRPLYR
jgi:hypothetical protein